MIKRESKRLGIQVFTLIKAAIWYFLRLSYKEKNRIIAEYYDDLRRIEKEKLLRNRVYPELKKSADRILYSESKTKATYSDCSDNSAK